MMQPHLFGTVLSALAVVLACGVEAIAAGTKSDSKVKATASASKIDAKGKQTVTITLKVDKGWHLYANPVNHEFLEGAATTVKITSKNKQTKAKVNYPAGRQVVVKKDKYNVYEGEVKISATVTRAAGDTSPLELVIGVNACDDGICLAPGKLKLTVR